MFRKTILCLVPGLQNPGAGNTGMTNMYLMLAIWFAIALLLFLFRPRALRNNRDTLNKPRNQVWMILSTQLSSLHIFSFSLGSTSWWSRSTRSTSSIEFDSPLYIRILRIKSSFILFFYLFNSLFFFSFRLLTVSHLLSKQAIEFVNKKKDLFIHSQHSSFDLEEEEEEKITETADVTCPCLIIVQMRQRQLMTYIFFFRVYILLDCQGNVQFSFLLSISSNYLDVFLSLTLVRIECTIPLVLVSRESYSKTKERKIPRITSDKIVLSIQ